MKILITKPESIAVFFGFDSAEYRDNNIIFSLGIINCDYNESNSMIIDVAPPPTNLFPNIWKYENDSWIIANQNLYDLHESNKLQEELIPE